MSSSNLAVTTLVVDDEPLARAGLRRLLAEHDWLRVIGDADSGPAALQTIDALRPELVFLDVQMPGFSGLDVLRQVRHKPFVVFTTAFAEHAIAAYEIGAIDYLLKPFGPDRLAMTLARVRAAVGEPAVALLDRLADVLGERPVARLFVRTGRAIVPIATADIAWIAAVGDYVAIHANGAEHLLHLALNRLEERLDPDTFVRIHRSHLVNLAHVSAFSRQTDGQYVAQIRDGTSLPVSRAKAQLLRAFIR
jgi:two-component system, LytTR family, response regulator